MQHGISIIDTSLFTTNDSSKELEQVIEMWKSVGLEPTMISEGDVEQTIKITNNPITSTLKWELSKMSPIVGLGILTRTMFSIFKDGIKTKETAKGRMNIAISFEDGKLAIGMDSTSDLNMVVGVLSAALWEILQRLHGDKAHLVWTNVIHNDN